MKKDYLKNDYYFNNQIEKTKKELQDFLISYKNELEILKSIKRVKKKDWSDFQNFLKNFSIMDWIKMYYDDLWYKEDIKISWYINNRYEKIYLNTYSIDENFVKEIEKSDPTRVIKNTRRKDHVYYNVDEFMQEISKKIDRIEKHIKELEKTLENIDQKIEKLEKLLDPLLDFIWNSEDWNIARYLKEISEITIKNFYDYK